MPLRSILSLLYPPPSLAASAQLGVKWEKLSSERMPTNVRPFPPALAHVRDVWSLAGRGHCDGMVTPAMDAPQFQAHSISLPSSLSASTECHRIVSSSLPIELVSRGAVAFVVVFVVVVIVFCNGGAMKPQGEEEGCAASAPSSRSASALPQ